MKPEAQQNFVTGKKIALRGLRRDDMELYRSWLENTNVTHYMESGWRATSDVELEAIFRTSTEPPDTSVFVILERETGVAVGVVGLYLIQWVCRRGEFRILIGDERFVGKGLGTEAAQLMVSYGFNHLNLDTIYLGVNVENKRAIGSYEKAGFQREGVRRQLIYRNGRYYDALMMSILRQEWQPGQPAV